jgi:hypothetical protein
LANQALSSSLRNGFAVRRDDERAYFSASEVSLNFWMRFPVLKRREPAGIGVMAFSRIFTAGFPAWKGVNSAEVRESIRVQCAPDAAA